MREKLRNRLFVLAGLLCLAGCGKENNDHATLEQGVANICTTTARTESLYINDCILLKFENPEIEYPEKTLFYDTYESKLYMLWTYYGKENTMEHLSLYVFDGDTKEISQQSFDFRIPSKENSYIKSMDVQNGNQLSFRMKNNEGDFLVITDLEGNVILSQESFPDQEVYPWNADIQQRYANRAFDIGDGSIILSRCRDQENVTELFLYDPESGEETPLSVFDGELVRSLCMDGAETMYYTTLESLNRWDRKNNTRTRLLNLHANGISASPMSGNLLVNSEGEVLVCEMDGDIPCVFVLSGEESQKEDELRITYFTGTGDSNLARSAQIFSQTHPELKIVQERCENENERSSIRDRIFMELASGRGPDLMWVLQEDMYDLHEKGLLMDMSELVPCDTQEQLVPGVIQSGTLDDKLVGMKLYVVYNTIMVSNALWEGDSWTVQDVIEIMKSREDWDFTFSYFLEGVDSYALLSEVLLPDLDGSEFLDIEKGYCNFNSPEFIKLLEVCKKYGCEDYVEQSRDEQAKQLKAGDGIAEVMCFVDGIRAFSAWMNQYDGSAHMVGFPTREGSKNYIMADNTYLVVNAKAKHLEEIKELIAYLLGYENQFYNSYMSVREDVIRDSVEYVDYENKYMLKVSASGDTRMTLAAKPDGTSWLEDYLAFIDTCEPEPRWRYTPVGVIISEEVQPYFAGDKSAEEVAQIIQSRVQLYLDESR